MVRPRSESLEKARAEAVPQLFLKRQKHWNSQEMELLSLEPLRLHRLSSCAEVELTFGC